MVEINNHGKDENTMKTTYDQQVTELWDYLLDNGIASEETLQVVTNINGYSLSTLEDVLYATTGYRSLEQAEEEEAA
jgi:hypothetical protein